MVSNARDDLPLPESPVTTTITSRGMETVMSLRLCSRAPRTTIWSSAISSHPSSSGRLRQVYGPLLGGQRSSLLLAIFYHSEDPFPWPRLRFSAVGAKMINAGLTPRRERSRSDLEGLLPDPSTRVGRG